MPEDLGDGPSVKCGRTVPWASVMALGSNAMKSQVWPVTPPK